MEFCPSVHQQDECLPDPGQDVQLDPAGQDQDV